METIKTKNVRAKMTQMMMDRIYARSHGGQSMEEILMDIAQGQDTPLELRFKAASKVADLIFPRAASVEVDMEQSVTLTGKEIDAKLAALLSKIPQPVAKTAIEEVNDALNEAEEVEDEYA